MGLPHVRRAVADDAHALAVIHVETWRAAYAGLMPDEVLAAQSIPDREHAWRERLSRPPAPEPRTWVVELDGRLLGFASTGPCRDDDATPTDTELYALYLDASAWGTGLGRALFAHAVEDVTARGYTAMTLWVLDGNARARRFYEAAGMKDDGGRKVEMEGAAPLPHVRYRLPLRPIIRR